MIEPVSEAPKREEQVLVLAAGGLTDKEIAIRLGISPDTVGTYWRRVLAKYQAASRTEVVAKYMEDRARVSMENLRYVNDCLKLFNEHMISVGGVSSLADSILASLSEWVLVIDPERKIVFSNRPIPMGSELAEVFGSDDEFASLSLAAQGPVEVQWSHGEEVNCEFTLTPGAGALSGHVVATGHTTEALGH